MCTHFNFYILYFIYNFYMFIYMCINCYINIAVDIIININTYVLYVGYYLHIVCNEFYCHSAYAM